MIYGLNKTIVLISLLLASNAKFSQMIVTFLFLRKVSSLHSYGRECRKNMSENKILWLRKQELRPL
jgi:hypothetical protein